MVYTKKERLLRQYVRDLEEENGELKRQYDHIQSLFHLLLATKMEPLLNQTLVMYYEDQNHE